MGTLWLQGDYIKPRGTNQNMSVCILARLKSNGLIKGHRGQIVLELTNSQTPTLETSFHLLS